MSDPIGNLPDLPKRPPPIAVPASTLSPVPFFAFPRAPGLSPANSVPQTPPSVALVNETYEKVNQVIPEIDKLSVRNALRNDFTQKDPSKAAFLLEQYRDAAAGVVVSISNVKARHALRGAVNTNGISCYMDSLLFAMFGRMENFEPLLYQSFDDPVRDTLSTWLRLFVNLCRLGELITKDIVHGLLAACVNAGWTTDRMHSGSINSQQDAAELFGFLTDALKMPKLTLRVEIAHAGRENAEDDHKVVTEQLLYLPVPGTKEDMPLLLEECLEMYFANSINVNRRPARGDSVDLSSLHSRQRSYSIVSTHTVTTLSHTPTGVASPRKSYAFQDLDDGHFGPQTPPGEGPMLSQLPHQSPSAVDSPLPSYAQLFGDDVQQEDVKRKLWTSNNEITFPAWMFLQLMPFYADVRSEPSNMENLEAQQVAQHFSKTRPVLGLCLKRYFWGPNGEPMRNDRKIVVPETIFMPSFVADDSDRDQAFGDFKLELESAIFHRGNSIHSGHYIGMVCDIYDTKPEPDELKRSFSWRSRSKSRRYRVGRENQQRSKKKRWLLFDDMAPDGEKVAEVDFNRTMNELCPYMLFYRMVALESPPSLNGSKETSPSPPDIATESIRSGFLRGDTPQYLDTLEEEPLSRDKANLHDPRAHSDGLSSTVETLHISDSSPELVPLNPKISPDPLGRASDFEYADRDSRRRRHRFLRRSQKDYAASYREEKCTLM